jgi:plastocyanin
MHHTSLTRVTRLVMGVGALAIGLALVPLAAHPAGAANAPAVGPIAAPAAKSGTEIRLRDDCDPVTFNAQLGAGACVGNGGTTVDEFNAELQRRGSVNAWKYNPDNDSLDPGESLTLVNRGGETHTFTKVARFGGGFVAGLNQASGNPTPAPECATVNADGTLTPKPASATNLRVAGGTSTSGPAVGNGTTLFQCCIHPWMRVTVTRR